MDLDPILLLISKFSFPPLPPWQVAGFRARAPRRRWWTVPLYPLPQQGELRFLFSQICELLPPPVPRTACYCRWAPPVLWQPAVVFILIYCITARSRFPLTILQHFFLSVLLWRIPVYKFPIASFFCSRNLFLRGRHSLTFPLLDARNENRHCHSPSPLG